MESGNTKYDSRDDCNAIIETETNTLVCGCQSTIIPNNVTSIGDGAFSECSGLTSLEIPENVTSIGTWAFSGCSGLTSMNLSESVTSIGSGAFSSCSGLTSIIIPESVTTIDGLAFAACSGLTSVTCHAAELPVTDATAFQYNDMSKATLYVPSASLYTYKATEPWSSFGTVVSTDTTLVLADVSYTHLLVNPNFDDGMNGWDYWGHDIPEYMDGSWATWHTYDSSYSNGDSQMNLFVERWVYRGTTLEDGCLSQEIENIPNGLYRVEADIIACQQDNSYYVCRRKR